MIRLCTVTSVERLSKAFSLNKDGSLKKEPGGSLYRGDARNISVVDLRDLARVLGTLNQKQALTFGIHKGANNPVKTRSTYWMPQMCPPFRVNPSMIWAVGYGAQGAYIRGPAGADQSTSEASALQSIFPPAHWYSVSR